MYYCKSIRLAGRLNLFFFAGCYLVDLDGEPPNCSKSFLFMVFLNIWLWMLDGLAFYWWFLPAGHLQLVVVYWLGLPFIRIFERRHVMIDVSNVLVVTYYQLCWGWKLSVNNTGLAKLDEDGQWLVKSVCFHIDECFILNMRPIFSNPVIL